MSTPRLCTSLLVALAFGASLADEAPDLGEAVDEAVLARVDHTILPDGDGLPDGSGTAADGAMVYQQNCLACHGERGTDGINDRLAGGHGSLVSIRPIKTVGSFWPYATTVFDYVRRAMPYQDPGSLSNDEIYAVTAYLLFVNDIVAEDKVIDAESLPLVKMPNRDGFAWDYTPQ